MIERHYCHTSYNTSCVYLAVEDRHCQFEDVKKPIVKVGMTRGMWHRRGALYQTYGVRTVHEIAVDDKWLEVIELHLIQWLQSYPTAQKKSKEVAYIDANQFALMMIEFPQKVKEIEKRYKEW